MGAGQPYAWFSENYGNELHEGGGKAPNGIGAFDMSGNVDEFCWDWGRPASDVMVPQTNLDPKGPVLGQWRVSRGGSCADQAYGMRVCFVRNQEPYLWAYYFIGFRVARSAQ